MKMKSAGWIITDANNNYELVFVRKFLFLNVLFHRLCPSYPKLLIVPKCYTHDRLRKIAKFRKSGRLPAVVWRLVATSSRVCDYFFYHLGTRNLVVSWFEAANRRLVCGIGENKKMKNCWKTS